ncbi:GxxExxY protein [Candidatus Collierbacteria bacterium]|nr:GxxExxY protein [Candidatus Collierbacteria bacterium]
MHPNDPNNVECASEEFGSCKIILRSYRNIFCIHNELGRYCREKQYGDRLELLLREAKFEFSRAVDLSSFGHSLVKGNRADFVVDNKIVVDLKTKPVITKEDYNQMQRYLKGSWLELGLIVNFRNKYLKPKRVLNIERFHSDNSDRL